MVSQKVVIKNPTGLHLRPAGILCKEAMQFKSLITFLYRESTANAKSVLSVLGACVKCGDEITLNCDGEDEEEALKALIQAIESGLRKMEGLNRRLKQKAETKAEMEDLLEETRNDAKKESRFREV
jgi:phosphocarrier protein